MEKQIKSIMGADISKSQKMIQLYDLGLEVAAVAKLMGVRYNFVYNVVSNRARMTGTEVRKVAKTNKKQQILDLIAAGKTNVEIAKLLQTNYNYVYSIRKDLEVRAELEKAKAE